MAWILDPFANGFMQRALVAGVLTVITTSLVGTWVVLRGMAFMGDAMAHGVIPGITLAYLLGVNLGIGAAVSALVMVGGINLVGRRSSLGEDTSIGLLFVGMLALGVIIISKRGAYAGDLTGILFGDAIGVTSGDVRAAAIAVAITLVATLVLYRAFLALSFSPDKAALLGLRPGLANLGMLALVGLAVVTSFQTVGTLLVFAFLIAPPAAASLIARRVPVMMAVAMVIGSLGVVIGLLVSFYYGTAASPTVAGIAVLEFFVVLVVRETVAAWRHRGATIAAGRPG